VDTSVIEPLIDDHQNATATSDLVWRAMRRLPVRQSTALTLRFAMDWPINDVAVAMRIPSGTVKSLCARGLESLKIDPDLTEFQFYFNSETSEVDHNA
jgi:DNA-directed RNA polymerase specialized sigma24 family protein